MATKKQLIEGAYAEIGLANYVFDLQPEEFSVALDKLDRMAAGWDALGIRVGYALRASERDSSLDDESGIPDWAEEAFITNLAIRLAPSKGKQVSQDTRLVARDAYNALLVGNYQIPQMQMPRTMPIGTGNRRAAKNQVFFAPVDRVTTTNDGTLEPSGNPWPDSL